MFDYEALANTMQKMMTEKEKHSQKLKSADFVKGNPLIGQQSTHNGSLLESTFSLYLFEWNSAIVRFLTMDGRSPLNTGRVHSYILFFFRGIFFRLANVHEICCSMWLFTFYGHVIGM